MDINRRRKMETIEQLSELTSKISTKQLQAVFIFSKTCSVCFADKKTVEVISKRHDLPVYLIEAEKSPEIIGQLNGFSAPTLILFYEGKEIHRQVKIINFTEAERRITQFRKLSKADNTF